MAQKNDYNYVTWLKNKALYKNVDLGTFSILPLINHQNQMS